MPTVTAPVTPNSATFFVVEDANMGGGFRCVETDAALLTIPQNYRKRGMLVYSSESDAYYKLGADLESWSNWFVSGSSSTNTLKGGLAANPRNVYLVGDSLSYNTYNGTLQTLLRQIHADWTVSHRGVGGDTITMIRQRLEGGTYHGPVRGADTLSSGANIFRVSPYLPPLNDEDGDSDYQLFLRRGGSPYASRFILNNRGEYAATLTQRTFYARCHGTSRLRLYEEVANAHEVTNAGNETAAMTASTLGVTLSQSDEVGSCDEVGQYAAKMLLDDQTGFHGYYMTPTADSIYDVDAWVYIPSGGIPSVSITWNGTDSVQLSSDTVRTVTATDGWARIHAKIYVGADATSIAIGFSSGTAYESKAFYLDNIRVRRTHGLTSDHELDDNDGCFLQVVPGGLVSLPSGLRINRNYYAKNVGGSTTDVELLMSSGGTQDTYTGTGWALLYSGWRGSYTFTPLGGTPDPDDSKDFQFTIDPEYPERAGVWIVWAGSNNNYTQAELVKAETRRIVGMNKSGRVILLSPLGSTSFPVGHRQRDWLQDHAEWLLAEYGDNAIDATALLIANHDGSAEDRADAGNGIHPLSMRSDIVHLSTAGNLVIAEAVYDKMISLGFV